MQLTATPTPPHHVWVTHKTPNTPPHQRGEDTKFDGYKELQKVLRSLKTKAPMTLPDTLRQDELRKTENYSSY